MKSIILLLLVILSFQIAEARKHHRAHHRFAKHKHLSRSRDGPKETPSALQLENHFGSGKGQDYYGPKPINYKQSNTYTGVDGQRQFVETKVPDGCDIRRASYYQICDSITECTLCAKVQQCGWCQATGECMPNCAKQNCPYTFTFDRKKCQTDKVEMGCFPLPGIAPDATHFINPELDNVPKQHLTFNNIGLEKKREKVLFAYNHQRAIVTAHDIPNNRIFDDLATVPVPLYTDKAVVRAKHGKGHKVVRAEDGVELKLDEGETKLHGFNTVAPRAPRPQHHAEEVAVEVEEPVEGPAEEPVSAESKKTQVKSQAKKQVSKQQKKRRLSKRRN